MRFIESLSTAYNTFLRLMFMLLLTAVPVSAMSAPILLNGYQSFTNLGTNESLACTPGCDLWEASIETFQFNVGESASYVIDASPGKAMPYEPYMKIFEISMNSLNQVNTTGGGFGTFDLTSGLYRVQLSFAGSWNLDDGEFGSKRFLHSGDDAPLESFSYLLKLRAQNVPEPSALILLVIGLAGLSFNRKKAIKQT